MLNTYLRVIISSGSCSISLVSSNFIGLCVVVGYAELGFILIQAFGDLNLKWGFLVFQIGNSHNSWVTIRVFIIHCNSYFFSEIFVSSEKQNASLRNCLCVLILHELLVSLLDCNSWVFVITSLPM